MLLFVDLKDIQICNKKNRKHDHLGKHNHSWHFSHAIHWAPLFSLPCCWAAHANLLLNCSLLAYLCITWHTHLSSPLSLWFGSQGWLCALSGNCNSLKMINKSLKKNLYHFLRGYSLPAAPFPTPCLLYPVLRKSFPSLASDFLEVGQ